LEIDPNVDNALTARQLDSMAQQKGTGETVLWGLTTYIPKNPRISFSSRTRPAKYGNGRCVSTQSGSWSVEFRMPATIHIADELLPGSCPFNAVLRHEQQHIRAVADLLREYARHLARALSTSGLPTRDQEWWAATEDQADAAINRTVITVVKPLLAEYKAAVSASNREIDSVDETRGACPEADWIRADTRYNMGGNRGR
jgi:hypothetical protein